jgi:WD40 repeat protein
VSRPHKKYWAFLSYSHADAKVCDWLHPAIERFSVPRRLRGKANRDGTIPSRLFPVFRDRAELPGSSELSTNLVDALAESRYLVVICSPSAATSRWVNEEIRLFKKAHGEGHILALISSGEPNASDHPERGLAECFPEALRYRFDEYGEQTTERAEPIAADIRPGHESRRIAMLRLVAGLIGVSFDELRQRDRERTRKQWQLRALYASAACAAMTLILATFFHAQTRQRLEDLGRESLMRGDPAAAAVFLSKSYSLGGSGNNLLVSLDQAMRSVDALSDVHTEHSKGTAFAMFSSDGSRLLATGTDGDVLMWRTDNGQQLLHLPPGDQKARIARFMPGSTAIALIGPNGSVEQIDSTSAQVLARSDGQLGREFAIDSRSEESSDILMQDSASGEAVVLRLGPTASPVMARFECSLAQLIESTLACVGTASDRSTIRLIPLAGSAAASAYKAPFAIATFAVSRDAHRIAVADSLGNVRLFSAPKDLNGVALNQPGGTRLLHFSRNGDLLVGAGQTGGILAWNTQTAQIAVSIKAHDGPVVDALASSFGSDLVSIGEDGRLNVWNLLTGALLTVQQANHGSATRIAVSQDGEHVVSYADGRQIDVAREHVDPALKVWDLPSALPDARGLSAKAARKGDTKVGHCQAATMPRPLANDTVEIPVRDSIGKSIVLSAGNDTAGAVFDCSVDQALVVTGGRSGVAIVWDVASAKPLARFSGHLKPLTEVHFLDDSTKIETIDATGETDVWSVAPETRPAQLIARRVACRIPLALHDFQLIQTPTDPSACRQRETRVQL